jgi:tetratricopeptide (TPR) repeat protein
VEILLKMFASGLRKNALSIGCALAIGVSSVAPMSARAQASATASPEIQEVSRLVRAGQYNDAISKANAVLAAKPKDALARFLKGVALTETGKTNDAIATFQSITEDNPELPEPYNNLAVLYASKGQFEKARTALELAIQTHPSYSTAHENLGDVYAKLASQAYDRALQLDKGNSAIQSKLSLIRDLFSTQPKVTQKPDTAKVAAMRGADPAPSTAAPAVAPVRVAASAPTASVAAVPMVTPIGPSPTPAPTAVKPSPVPTPSAAPAVATSLPAVVKPASTPSANNEADAVLAAVKTWAKVWSSRDADGYLSAYASEFKPDDGRSRKSWEAERRERVQGPAFIKVDVLDPVVILSGDSAAEVKFRQTYNSDRLKNHSVRKTLSMVKTKSGWQIAKERNG